MALTEKARTQLEARGTANVLIKLVQTHRDPSAPVADFESGHAFRPLTRNDIEDWLAEKSAEDASDRRRTLFWATVSAMAGIASVLVGTAAIALTVWLRKL
jgi:hypothetical protein